MSLQSAVGAGPTVEIAGSRLTVNPRILRHFAEIEAQIVHKRGNPFDIIREAKDTFAEIPELMDRFVEKAFDEAKKWKMVSHSEIVEYIGYTLEGRFFAVWLSIRDNDRSKWTLDYTIEKVADEYESIIRSKGAEAAEEWLNGIGRTIEEAGGEDELGNSTGSSESTQTETVEAASSQP